MASSPLHRLARPGAAFPVLTYPGAALIGVDVAGLITRAEVQVEAQLALAGRYPLRALLTCMDLSVEAEAFGAGIQITPDEVPTVIGRRVTGPEDLPGLELPKPGAARTAVHLEATRQLRRHAGDRLVVGGMVGPFSLAARLYGVSEALGLTLTDPGLMHELMARATAFLLNYAAAFREAGADAVFVAEPTAGLLSPRGLAEFSARYVRQMTDALQTGAFSIILHNCAARRAHLAVSLEAGSHALHFGSPMDLAGALDEIPPDRVVMGNLDPAGVFVQGTPETVREKTRQLIALGRAHPNWVLSSGCDLPPTTPLTNVDAFFDVLNHESPSSTP